MKVEGFDAERVTKSPPTYAIDKSLDEYGSRTMGDGKLFRWWWNGDTFLAEAIASACRHVRKHGCHVLDKRERAELKTLEKYFSWYVTDDWTGVDVYVAQWLHAEAFWLLSGWFGRLWD